MNNKGQVLIFFVLIIPILLVGAAYIIDNLYIAYNMNKLNQINRMVIKEAAADELSIEKIIEYIYINDDEIEVELISKNSDIVEIKLKKDIKSLFGRIIGKDTYTLLSNKTINVEKDDLTLYQ